MFKKIICLLLAAAMLFSLVGCIRESPALLKRIDELEALLKEQADRLEAVDGENAALRERVAELESENIALRAKVVQLEAENKALRERIAELEKEAEELRFEVEYLNILKEFDLIDPKILWDGEFPKDRGVDTSMVIVTMRKTSTYPELDIKYFKFQNAESLEYYPRVTPPLLLT